MFKTLDPNDYSVVPYTVSRKFSAEYDKNNPTPKQQSIFEVHQGIFTLPPFLEKQYENPSLRNGVDGPYKKMVYDLIYHFYYKYDSDYNKFGVRSYKDIDLSSFKKGETNRVWVIKVSPKRYGEKIRPESVVFEFPASSSVGSFLVTDDGNGNLYSENGVLVGNVFYSNGVVVFTKRVADGSSGGGAYTYFPSYAQFSSQTFDFKSFEKFTLHFENTVTLYEHEIQCTIEQHEFNGVTNPSVKDFDGNFVDYYKSEKFSPYITTVGLYDEFLNLVAIGKLSTPIQKPKNTPLTINIKFDT